MARVYQPLGAGPFPVLLDLHGGAWNDKDRFANEPMARAISASGVLVASIDLTLAPEAPYPASVQDANYGVRWLKWKAPGWKGEPATLGVLGSSTGGHLAQLVGMRPRDARYGALACRGARRRRHGALHRRALADQRPLRALPAGREEKARRHDAEDQELVRALGRDLRGEPAADPRAPRARDAAAAPHHAGLARRQRAARAAGEVRRQPTRAAGGECRLEIFENCDHMWVADPGPQTDRAHEMVKHWIQKYYE
jgi:acetyl esterase/lipase